MRSKDEIKGMIERYEKHLELLRQNYKDNKDENMNLLYIRQIGITEGMIKGLKIALGSKVKLKLKNKQNLDI